MIEASMFVPSKDGEIIEGATGSWKWVTTANNLARRPVNGVGYLNEPTRVGYQIITEEEAASLVATISMASEVSAGKLTQIIHTQRPYAGFKGKVEAEKTKKIGQGQKGNPASQGQSNAGSPGQGVGSQNK